MKDAKLTKVQGRAVAVRGNDIDTDRIIPARFLRCVTFDGLGEHAFEDDRAQLKQQGKLHPFDDQRFAGARILLVNKNFGCGSSREHAPQALMRWGIAAIVGESFAEIFFGNCIAIGVPCVTVDTHAIGQLMEACESDPQRELVLDLQQPAVSLGAQRLGVSMPPGAQQQFLEGRWDSTSELLQGAELVAKTASTLPYFNEWRPRD